MRKNKIKQTVVATFAAFAFFGATAGGFSGILDGMFANVTAPNVVQSQFRGAISGGSVYVRAPVSTIQLISFDPPRLSMGCGGIDLYLGSFSFITADKLTQFIRNIAQNAAPLVFQLAIESAFPHLGANLKEFRAMAQQMNDSQRSSCQVAQTLVGDFAKSEAGKAFTSAFSEMGQTVRGFVSDFTEATKSDQTDAAANLKEVRTATDANGNPISGKFGNITWNALIAREKAGFGFNITDDPVIGKEILLGLIGTRITKEGLTPTETLNLPITPQRTSLMDIIYPITDFDGAQVIPLWDCGSDTKYCISPTQGRFVSAGVSGYVRNMLMGTETPGAVAVSGSIIDKMINCTDSGCALSSTQINFLNSLGKVPVVALLFHAQQVPEVIAGIADNLVNVAATEVAALYARQVVGVARDVFSNTDAALPDDYLTTMRELRSNLSLLIEKTDANNEKILKIGAFIDAANRTHSAIIRYRPTK